MNEKGNNMHIIKQDFIIILAWKDTNKIYAFLNNFSIFSKFKKYFFFQLKYGSSFTLLPNNPFFIGVADNNFGFVLHFTKFHWTNNAHVEIQPITSKVMAYLKFSFSRSCTRII